LDNPGKAPSAMTSLPADMKAESVATTVFEGQKPGTSGLRKKTREFMKEHYLENFVQSVFNALVEANVQVAGGTLAVGGDGRFHNKVACQTIIKMAVANGVKKIWVGKDGLLSTPAMSAVIRTRAGGFVPFGGFILSASHNPGGIDEDFGIKFNGENGGPAPEKVTDLVYKHTTQISEYKIAKGVPEIDLTTAAKFMVGEGDAAVEVEVIDSTEDHVNLLKQCFDFEMIKKLAARPDFSMVYDSMHGVQGPYARKVMCEELGLPESSCLNAVPKEDFGGAASPSHGHADPNLTHAVELVKIMGLNAKGEKIDVGGATVPCFGAAADGDADRNMILGRQFFVSPSDSLALLVSNAACIPQFKDGLKGVARSMPTSGALERVATANNIPFFETPTGWKFFGNLMDSGNEKYFPGKPVYTPFICGEESFGTGSDHVREKDGLWAVLAWMQILAVRNSDPALPFVSVEEIASEHWRVYGRNYYARYDYEGVDKAAAEKMMADMGKSIEDGMVGKEFGGFKIKVADIFQYEDPIDGSISKNQGVRWMFEDGSRVIFRLSGTGVAGATVRVYLEKYAGPSEDIFSHAFTVVEPLAAVAKELSGLTERLGREAPTVIT